MKKTFLWFLILLFSSIAHGEKVALTIGNDLYINVPKLQKARNDAVLIGTNLEKIGYKVTVLKDTTYKEMVTQIDHFISKISIDDESLNIYIERGTTKDPIHVCYWHIDEVEEDATVAFTMLTAMELYYTNQPKLCKLMNVPKEFIILK